MKFIYYPLVLLWLSIFGQVVLWFGQAKYTLYLSQGISELKRKFLALKCDMTKTDNNVGCMEVTMRHNIFVRVIFASWHLFFLVELIILHARNWKRPVFFPQKLVFLIFRKLHSFFITEFCLLLCCCLWLLTERKEINFSKNT